MSYLDAPQTQMLEIKCSCCGKPLVDAESVEIGIGPICREKYGYNIDGISEENRTKANSLVKQSYIAFVNKEFDKIINICDELFKMGFETLAIRILKRTKSKKTNQITITENDQLEVYIPYPLFNKVKHQIDFHNWKGYIKWDHDKKCRVWNPKFKRNLAVMLATYFQGATLISNKGESVIQSPEHYGIPEKKEYKPYQRTHTNNISFQEIINDSNSPSPRTPQRKNIRSTFDMVKKCGTYQKYQKEKDEPNN